MNKKAALLRVTPVAAYQTPKLPTYEGDRPNLEQKVPRRWKNKVMAAGAGLLTVTTLAGCETPPTTDPEITPLLPSEVTSWSGWKNHDCRMHHGGAGGGPIYVAYLTEQEALGIIRGQLEAAGLKFDDALPNYRVEIDDSAYFGEIHHIGLGLFNEENKLGISIINPDHFHIPFFRFEIDEVAEAVTSEFQRQYPHLSVSLFCNPNKGIWNWDFYDDDNELVTSDEKAEARQWLIDNLVQQTRGFIEHLRSEGVIN